MIFTSLTIEYLNKCNLRCAHCAVGASPEESDKIKLEDAKNWITIARDYGAKEISICGGEPFLVFDELCELARHSNSLGLDFVTFSNAFWAQTPEKTQEYLFPLKETGLTSLHLSFDCFHLREGIPLENFLNVASVASDIGLDLVINVLQSKRKEISPNFVRKTFKDYRVHFQYTSLRPLGRATGLNRKLFIKEKRDNYKKGCLSPGLLIGPRGGAYACCGAYHLANSTNPLKLGSVFNVPFPRIIEKFSNLKLLAPLTIFGPSFIYDLIKLEEKGFSDNSLYSCDLCCNLLNSQENVKIINEKLESPDQDLKVKLEIAELFYKNRVKVKLSCCNSGLVRFCKHRFPALWGFTVRAAKVILNHK